MHMMIHSGKHIINYRSTPCRALILVCSWSWFKYIYTKIKSYADLSLKNILCSDLLEYGCFYNFRQIHTYGEEYNYVKDMLILTEGLHISEAMMHHFVSDWSYAVLVLGHLQCSGVGQTGDKPVWPLRNTATACAPTQAKGYESCNVLLYFERSQVEGRCTSTKCYII